MKHYLIYKITNLLNGMIYIGKHVTDDIHDDYMGSSKWLKLSIKKHGIENYRKEILFDFDNDADMNAKERELVNEEFVARSETYNLNVGGFGSWYACNVCGDNNKSNQYLIAGIKCQLDAEYRRKFCQRISNGLKLFYAQNPGALAGENNPMYGKTHSDDTRLKISNALKGMSNNQFGKHWYTNSDNGDSFPFADDPGYPWVKGRNLFHGEYVSIINRLSKHREHMKDVQQLWDEFHSGDYASLAEFAKYKQVTYVAIRNRFAKFIPLFIHTCQHGVPFSSNIDLVGVYT